MTDATNSTIDFFIVAALFVLDALTTLMSGITKGIIKKKPVLATKRTQTQLKKMLKKDLVELVLTYQN